jgi:hypothetical protein
MNCPICSHQGLNEFSLRCPKCESDLTALHKIDDIQEKYVANAKQRTFLEGEVFSNQKNAEKEISVWKKKSNRYLALFLLLPLVYKFCLMPKQDPQLVMKLQILNIQDSINRFKIQQYEVQVADLERDTLALQASKKKRINYTLVKGETLASLGIRFFGNKNAAYRIAKDNKITAAEYDELPVGRTVIINFR